DYTILVFNHVDNEGVRVICMIMWHIDNSLTGSNSWTFLDCIKVQIAEHFSIMDLEAVIKYLGV
ncbi:hypothetical protein BDR06DRAFT_886260, partial [Suillus hirtellus]